MDRSRELADLGGGDLLREVERLHTEREAASAQILMAAVEWAHQRDRECATRSNIPGGERLARPGGEGTPMVAEFAGAELGSSLQLSPYAGMRLIADALDLRYRLPRLWERVQRLEVREGYARFVARKTRDLTLAQAGQVDAAVADVADGRIPWSRFESVVEAAIKKADLEGARAREEAAAREQFARATRASEHGMAGFYIRADVATIARIEAAVAHLAERLRQLGHEGTLDERRVLAVLVLTDPAQALRLLTDPPAQPGQSGESGEPGLPDPADLLPTICLYVHLGGTGVARIEPGDTHGVHGPVTEEWVRHMLGERCRFRIVPVVDPLGQAPIDAYEIPERHRQAVHLVTPADIFPYASNTTRNVDIDHTEPWGRARDAGRSEIGNYGPMTRFHHRIKTHGAWDCKQPYPGLFVWRDPFGRLYLVDHTGTRRLSAVA